MSFAEYARRTLPVIDMPKIERPAPEPHSGEFVAGERVWYWDHPDNNPMEVEFVEYTYTDDLGYPLDHTEATIIWDDGFEDFVLAHNLTPLGGQRPLPIQY